MDEAVGSFVKTVVEEHLRCPFLGSGCVEHCRAFVMRGGVSHCLRLVRFEEDFGKNCVGVFE